MRRGIQKKEVILQSRIEQLEAEKAELIECIEYAIDQLGDLNYNFIYGKDILKKHGVEI